MSSPYLIQQTPAAIAFSGGRTSGYMLAQILDAHNGQLPPDVVVTFENTGEEATETYDFIHEIETRWCPVVWLEYWDAFRREDYIRNGVLSKNRRPRDLSNPSDWGFRIVDWATSCRQGEPYDNMLDFYWTYRREVKGEGPILPTRVTRMCTSHLKIKTQDRFMRTRDLSPYDAYTGIRYDEPKRWAKMAAINDRSEHYTVVYPMVPAKVTKEMVLDFWSRQPFDLGLDPLAEEGNCRYCFLKKTSRIVSILRKHIQANGGIPDAEIERWLRRERDGGMYFRKDRPPVERLVQIAMSNEEIKPSADEQEIDCFCGSPAV